MTENEINRIAELLFDKICALQEEADVRYHEQIHKLMKEGYVIDNYDNPKSKKEFDDMLNEEERLVGELARLQTIMMIFEGNEEYEKAALVQKKIKTINRKLNNGSGKY